MATMTDAQREKLTKIAVVDCISESPEIEAYFRRHPEIDPKEGVDLGEVLHDIESHDDTYWKIDDPYFQILKSYQESNSEEFNKLVIRDYTATEDRGRYVTVQTDTVNGEPYYQVSFNGTMSAEGIDNAEGLYQESTVQQQFSLDYFKRVAKDFGFTEKHVALSGHSKGGNEVTYTCMTASGEYQDMIDLAVSLDGQGHSNEAMTQWKDNPFYKQKANKIYGLYGEYDYVHPLGNSVVPPEHQFYLHYDDNSLRDQDSKFESLHALNYLFCTDGEHHFIAQLEANGLPSDQVKYEKEFSKELMKLSPDQLKDGAKFLMSMFWSKPSPDGETGQFSLSALKSLMKAIGGAEDKKVSLFYQFIYELYTHGKLGDLINLPLLSDDAKWALISGIIWGGATVSFLEETAAYAFGYDPDAYQEQMEANLNAAGAEAAEHPEFWIDPGKMLEAAGKKANLGEAFRSEASGLKSAAGQAASAGSVRNDLILYGFEINAKINAMENKIKSETKKINAIRSNMLEAADQLIDCIATINGTLAYLRDTGNGFQQAEDDIAKAVHNWEGSILGPGMGL